MFQSYAIDVGVKCSMNAILQKCCTKCGEKKTFEHFDAHVGGKYGLRSICRACRRVQHAAYKHRTRDHVRAYGRDYFAKNKDRIQERKKRRNRASGWSWRLRTLYGITPEEKAAMLTAQGEVCACCGNQPQLTKHQHLWHIDHDHEKFGREGVRGIICHRCNLGIGLFGDNAAGVAKALAYLLKYERQS